MAAAWELAKQPGFEITVIEGDVRLGGKGASVRDAQGRIVEHGLHVWLGFYENAFRMMRECYGVVQQQGWGPGPKTVRPLAHGSFDDAFFAEPHVAVAGPLANAWEVWSGQLPPMPGMPGTPLDAGSNPFSLQHYLSHALGLVRALVHSLVGGPAAGSGGAPRPDARAPADEAMDLDFDVDFARSPRAAIEGLSARLRGGAYVGTAVLLQAIAIFEDWLRGVNFAPQVADSAQALVEAITVQVRRTLDQALKTDPQARWKTTVIDLVMTILVGLYRDRVFWHADGLDSLNGFDYRTWLRKHGCSYDAQQSPFLRGIYDLVFAYRDGDRERPALAAGVALRGALRMFLGYRGALFWRMRSGMGDAVFAPLYQALAHAPRDDQGPLRSPVGFRFGSRLERVSFDPPEQGRHRVRELRLAVGAAPAPGNELDHFGCWPEKPRLPRARKTTVVLQADADFDAVIFACGPTALAAACRDANNGTVGPPRWHEACAAADLVGTVSAQVWLDRSLPEMGWLRGPVVLSGVGAPLDTWADMTHLLASEQAWREARPRRGQGAAAGTSARSLAYLCGALDAGDPPTRDDLERLLRGRAPQSEAGPWPRALWPRAFADDETAAARCVAADGQAAGAGALADQVWRVNDLGSDRYAQSLPGRVERRLSPLAHDVSNATVAGDWTACGLDAGCVEAAVMSGLLAVHALTGGTPALHHITGFDHP